MTKNLNETPPNPRRNAERRLAKKPLLARFRRRSFGWLLLVIIVFVATMVPQQVQAAPTLSWNEFAGYLDRGDIEKITIGDTEITGTFNENAVPAEKSLSFKVDYKPDSGDKEQLNAILDKIDQRAASDPTYRMPEIAYANQQVWLIVLLNWVLPVSMLLGSLFVVLLIMFLITRAARAPAGSGSNALASEPPTP